MLERHVTELKESSPDYVDDEDFEKRLEYYRAAYETVEVMRGYGTFIPPWSGENAACSVPAWHMTIACKIMSTPPLNPNALYIPLFLSLY